MAGKTQVTAEALVLANDSIVKSLLGFLIDEAVLSSAKVRELLEVAAKSQEGPRASVDNRAAADHIRQIIAQID